ncbi:MAG: T9SS C-terminal target domain-containing protein, partial [Calditrichaeota bacterium]
AFFVDIKVGSNSNPVTNLFGLSFVLNFTNTNYIDVVSPYNTNIVQGPFLGNDVVFYSSVDEAAGKVSIGISRKAGQGGVSGSGVVVRVKFIAKSNTPNGMQVKFSISDIIANDPNGNTITLTPSGLIITINSMVVWPGDTDNNGQVNQADVLPIGLCWNKTGPPRPNASISWVAQPATPWVPESCTYADANGDGIVNQADVLPIGLNWGRSHSSSSSQVSGVMPTGADIFSGNLNLKINGKGNPGELFWIEIYAEGVTDLFGISFELVYNPTTYVQAESVESGAWFGDDLVFFPNIDNTLGKVSVGISRKAGQGGISGSGLIARIKMKMAANAPMGYKTNLTLQNVQANDPMGNSISFDLGQGIIVTEVKSGTDTHLPAHFQLFENYPNPFNPETIITYEIPKPTVVQLDIFNLLGKHIYSLVNHKPQQAGKYRVKWNGRDQYGQPVPGGMYIYQLKAGDFIQARKMVLLR